MLVEAVVVGLVSYRVWRFLAKDDITASARDWVLSRTSPWVDALATCPWCLGSWLAIVIGLAAYFTGLTDSSPWLVIPAAAAVCGLLGQYAD